MKKLVDGLIYLVVGATRSGKTYWVLQQLKRYKRVIVWDIKGDPREFIGYYRATDQLDFIRQVANRKTGPLRITYTGQISDFDWFCKVAYKWANDQACAIVVDELSDVTTISKAPIAWGQIIRKVLCTGSDVYAMAQRPAEIDKTTVGNASVVHVHRMSRARDRKYIAEEMDIDAGEIAALSDRDYIEKDNRSQNITRFKYK